MKHCLKSNKIILITKKHTTWRKVFLLWLENDADLNVKDLSASFTTLLENKHALSTEINIDYAYSLLNDNVVNIGIIEKFNDKIQEVLHKKKKEQFISSLKTKKYNHLFNEEVELIIHTILDNKTPITVVKHQFFNKLSRYQTSDELAKSLSQFKEKNIGWNKKYYLNKIEQENLNVDVLEKENSLMVEVKDYKSCEILGSQAWCIVYNEKYFNSYTANLKRQYIYLDFDLPLEHNMSIIGFTVFMNGAIQNSYLKNDSATPHVIKNKFFFPQLPIKIVDKHIQSLANQPAFLSICFHGLTNFYDNFISKPDVDPSINDNLPLRFASAHGHFDIVKLLLKDSRVDPTDCNQDSLTNASRNGHIEIVKLLLTDNRIDPAKNGQCALTAASLQGHFDIVKFLLKDKRVNPSFNNNTVLKLTGDHGTFEIFKFLLADDRVNPAEDDDFFIRWASFHGHIKVVKILLADKRVNPAAENNFAMRTALENGHDEIVKLLRNATKINYYV